MTDMFKFPEVAILLKATGHYMCFEPEPENIPQHMQGLFLFQFLQSVSRFFWGGGREIEADTRGNNSWLNFEDNL